MKDKIDRSNRGEDSFQDTFWEHFGNLLETIWEQLGTFGNIVKELHTKRFRTFREHVGNNLGTFWERLPKCSQNGLGLGLGLGLGRGL